MLLILINYTSLILLAPIIYVPANGFKTHRHIYTHSSRNFMGKFDTYRNRHPTHLESTNFVNSELLGILNQRSQKTSQNQPRLLEKYGLCSKLSSGLYTILPLGNRILNRIKHMIEVEMHKLNAVELILPILQPKSILEDRLQSFGSELFTLKDRDKQQYYLSPTCEDLCSIVIKSSNFPLSKSHLPLCVYQINSKFRDEIRVSDLFSRSKEFLMLDAYSFHSNEDCSNVTYTLFLESFKNILNLMDLKFTVKEHNEDGINSEELRVILNSPEPSGIDDDPSPKDIEVAHLFKFGTSYSQKHDLKYETKDRVREDTFMNSYGIGLNRLLNALVHNHSDEFGLRLPQVLAPYDLTIISCNDESNEFANCLRKVFLKRGLSVLLDDRDDSIKNKMRDSKSVGIPHTILVSDKFQKMKPTNIDNKTWEELNGRSRVSNYYNLNRSAENVVHRNDKINMSEYMDKLVEYHPRTVKHTYVIKVKDFLNLLNIS